MFCGACRTLLDVSLIHFVVSVLSQIKHLLGLASTFECVRLCSEGKIQDFYRNGGYTCLCICENYKLALHVFHYQRIEKEKDRFYS